MKTKLLALTLALAAAATFTLNAAEQFLSPRAQANQIKTVPGVTEERLVRGLQPGSPKGRELLANYAAKTKVAGDRMERNLVTANRNVSASPRAIETFPWLASRDNFTVAPAVTPASPKK